MDVMQQELFPQTGFDEGGPQSASVGQPRRWPWAVSVGVLLLVAAGGWAMAWINADRASTWQATATELRAERDSTAATLAATEATLAETERDLVGETAKLVRSRAKVEELEASVRTLANEKASVEDEREIAEELADTMAGLAAGAAEVGERLDGCINLITSWLGRTPSYYDYEYQWESWAAEGDRVSVDCADAREAFSDLQWTLNF